VGRELAVDACMDEPWCLPLFMMEALALAASTRTIWEGPLDMGSHDTDS
jgi:hypothetical protein